MNVNEFIEKYKNSNDKEKYLAKHITNKYVSYATKIDECKRIIESTSYKMIGEQKVYYKNTPGQYFQFVLRLIFNYTDISIGEDIVSDYDLLNEQGLINIIIDTIPKSEYEEWRTILAMCDEDFYENTRSIPSLIDIKFEEIRLMLESLSNNPDIVKMLTQSIK